MNCLHPIEKKSFLPSAQSQPTNPAVAKNMQFNVFNVFNVKTA